MSRFCNSDVQPSSPVVLEVFCISMPQLGPPFSYAAVGFQVIYRSKPIFLV
jgi:hypothetical protein